MMVNNNDLCLSDTAISIQSHGNKNINTNNNLNSDSARMKTVTKCNPDTTSSIQMPIPMNKYDDNMNPPCQEKGTMEMEIHCRVEPSINALSIDKEYHIDQVPKGGQDIEIALTTINHELMTIINTKESMKSISPKSTYWNQVLNTNGHHPNRLPPSPSKRTYSSKSNALFTTPNSFSSENLPSTTLTITLRDIVTSRVLPTVCDINIENLLHLWIRTFEPTTTQRQKVRDVLYDCTPSESYEETMMFCQSLGFIDTVRLRELLYATEQLITLYFLMHTVWDYLFDEEYVHEPQNEGCTLNHTSYGLYSYGLGLGLDYERMKTSTSSTSSISKPTQWQESEICEFIDIYNTYINIDVITQICVARRLTRALACVLSATLQDTLFIKKSTELKRLLKRFTKFDNIENYVSILLQNVFEDKSCLGLCVILCNLRSIYRINDELGIKLSIELYPLLLPWNIEKLLLINGDDLDRDWNDDQGLNGTQTYWKYLNCLLFHNFQNDITSITNNQIYPLHKNTSCRCLRYSCQRDMNVVHTFIQLDLDLNAHINEGKLFTKTIFQFLFFFFFFYS